MSVGIWVPGDLVATNRALSDQRAAGFFDGYREAMIRAGKWQARRTSVPGQDRYAAAAAETRDRVSLVARAARLEPVPSGERVRLRFSFQGFERWDAAGGALAAKWAEDGLVEAGVIPSDRFNVAAIEVAVRHHSLMTVSPRGVYIEMERRP